MPGGVAPKQEPLHSDSQERGAQRFALFIRSAKLVCDGREYVCVIRDVSATGVKLRLFHSIPTCDRVELRLQTGDAHPVTMAWSEGNEAGFQFSDEIDLDRFLAETNGLWPKRPLRFAFDLPAKLGYRGSTIPARLCNLSQQGVGVLCEERLSIDQPFQIEAANLRDIVGKVRWRDGQLYGLVLDNTFRLDEFATLIKRLQDAAIRSERNSSRDAATPHISIVG